VYPYGLYRYGGGPTNRQPYDATDMRMTIQYPSLTGADGVVIWGSSGNVNETDCEQLQKYTLSTLGPLANQTLTQAAECSE